MLVQRQMSTTQQREYWTAVEQIAREVDSWPSWLKGAGSTGPKIVTPQTNGSVSEASPVDAEDDETVGSR